MAVIEIVGIQVDAADGHAGLVDPHHLADDLGVAAAVVHAVTQIRRDGHAGFADDGAAVLHEAHGVITGVAAAQLALRHHDADGQTVAHIVEVTVDAGHHTVAVLLQTGSRLGDGVPPRQNLARRHNGENILVGGVCDEVLGAQIGVGGTPEHIGGELGLLVQQDLLLRQIITQRIGRRGRHRQTARHGQRQQSGYCLAKKLFHFYLRSHKNQST